MIENQIKSKKRYKSAIAWLSLLLLSGTTFYFILVKRGYLFPLNHLRGILAANSTLSRPVHIAPNSSYLLNYNRTVPEIINSSAIDKSKTSILIHKSQSILTLYYDRQPIKSYPVVFGGNPTGNKLREGDRKTPEGIFKIRDLYPHQSWSKFIWLDYPNANSWRNHFQAKRQGEIPFNATIGSEIGLHGVPEGSDDLIDRQSNWTWGCISLKNKDVDELYSVVQTGTTVEIIP